jgi:hypothetical protein
MMLPMRDYLEQMRVAEGADDSRVSSIAEAAESWAIEVLGANFDPNAGFDPAVRQAVVMRAHGLYDSDELRLKIAAMLIEPWRDHTVA